MRVPLFAPLFMLLLSISSAIAQGTYQKPPKAIVDVLEAESVPEVSLAPNRQWLVMAHRRSMPRIDQLARPRVALGGWEIDPRTNAAYDAASADAIGFTLVRTADGRRWELPVPPEHLSSPLWSPDGRRFVFRHTTPHGVELWRVDVEAHQVRRLTPPVLNAARDLRGVPCAWLSDSKRMVCQFVVSTRGAPPAPPETPVAPTVEESDGNKAPIRIYGGMLQSPHDEALYDYYMTSQAVIVDSGSGGATPVGDPAIFETLTPSPNGRYVLAVRLVRPYSHSHPDSSFPKRIEILDLHGHILRTVAELSGDESGFSLMGWAPKGPRRISWAPTLPATLAYTEALDGGDPYATVPYRDRVMALPAPFSEMPRELIRTQGRLSPYPGFTRWYAPEGNVGWLRAGVAWVEEYDYQTHTKRVWLVDTVDPTHEPQEIMTFNRDDPSVNPGTPLITQRGREEPMLLQDGDWIYLSGTAPSNEGARPFLDRFNLKTHEKERIFMASGASYEETLAVLDSRANALLTRYETPSEAPRYLVRDRRGRHQSITEPKTLGESLGSIRVEHVSYTRADGVPLAAELYLPVDYAPGHPVPAVIWAYPREYLNIPSAPSGTEPRYRFPWTDSPMLLAVRLMATQGYAVLWEPNMPVMGGPHPNDTAVQQFVADATASFNELVQRGVADPHRIGIAGHSYGALMAATVIANTDLFAAAIAVDGAYNLTTDPFGFQSEDRTLWEIPSVYTQLSAYLQANRIKTPLLLIHGELDMNAAAKPGEARQMYQALEGLGAKARLVMLPYEHHLPEARESNLHVSWEMLRWFDRYLKHREGNSVVRAVRSDRHPEAESLH